MRSIQKFGLLSSLYIAQGLPFGFFTQSLPVLLRKEGMALETIGFSAVLVLPWALKFLWAPVLDKWGSRRTWIITANLLAVISMLILSFMPLHDLVADGIVILFSSFLLMNIFSATQDIATDSLAVNLLSQSERGIGNGIQVAGYRVGMILGGGLLLAWFTVLGWQYSMWILAAILLLATVPALYIHEKDHHQEQEELRLKDFFNFVKLPNVGLWLAIILTYKFGDHFSSTMVRPLLIDHGLGVKDIALILGTVGFAAGLIGALVGGWLVNLLGRFGALLLFGLIQVVAVSAWVLVPVCFESIELLYALSALEHFAGGLATAALFTVMMDHCRLACAGSDFTIQACLVVLASMIAAVLSGLSASRFGYEVHFLLAGGFAFVSLPLIVRYRFKLIGSSRRDVLCPA
jgi:PAT family beta-lactamase induction signal transducer AmpG